MSRFAIRSGGESSARKTLSLAVEWRTDRVSVFLWKHRLSSSATNFFDALPVEVVSAEGVLRIALRDGQFLETWWPASERELEYLDHYSVHPEPGERVEAPLLAQDCAARVAR